MKLKNLWNKIRHNHWLMMIICCAIPLILLALAIYIFGLDNKYIFWFILLLCPILHYFMTHKFLRRSFEFGGVRKCHTNSISDMKDMHKKHEKNSLNKHKDY